MKHHSPQIKPTLIDGQDYSSKMVEAGYTRWLLIGGDGKPHFSGLIDLFFSFPKSPGSEKTESG